METSLRGISTLFTARHSGLDGSVPVESVLQWIYFLQEKWLIVFDNADVPPPEVVEKLRGATAGPLGAFMATLVEQGSIATFSDSDSVDSVIEGLTKCVITSSTISRSDKKNFTAS